QGDWRAASRGGAGRRGGDWRGAPPRMRYADGQEPGRSRGFGPPAHRGFGASRGDHRGGPPWMHGGPRGGAHGFADRGRGGWGHGGFGPPGRGGWGPGHGFHGWDGRGGAYGRPPHGRPGGSDRRW